MFFHMVYKSEQIFLPFCHNSRVWRTDRQTDGQTEFSSLDRVCIPYSAVKTVDIFSHRPSTLAPSSPFPADAFFCIQLQKITLSLGCHPLDGVTRGGPPLVTPLVKHLTVIHQGLWWLKKVVTIFIRLTRLTGRQVRARPPLESFLNL